MATTPPPPGVYGQPPPYEGAPEQQIPPKRRSRRWFIAGIAVGAGVVTVVAVILALTYTPAGSTGLALSSTANEGPASPGACGKVPAPNGATVTLRWYTPSTYGMALFASGANSGNADLLQTFSGMTAFTSVGTFEVCVSIPLSEVVYAPLDYVTTATVNATWTAVL